ncbi:MAG TPA: 50S ribosomal protein L23 [Candidatus Aphodocola excrementigallinarum]|uniref:Large ribosomal subunit protein uL23 n=1 Tax=Candidatus Aphodocola excrementigallinarum TaxID=2840670 RepID=A0A9D1LJ04_9FIRM|nr:50S ribosomal protein L23 [Candidatus Aphodocola excrementigallinarum]
MKDIIKAPIVTEKTAKISADGKKVVLKVDKNTNKVQIKQAVEQAFDVKVDKVNTINVRPKKKRIGRYEGATKAYKKAIITLAEGSKLDLS